LIAKLFSREVFVNGLFVLLPALLAASIARANPSIYANCTGDGWSIDVGVQPGPATTELVQLTVDDGQGRIAAYEASIPPGNMKRALAAGLAFNNKTTAGDHATLKLKAGRGTYAYQGAVHALSCEIN
jgi:hypothetical protein